jgi:hypothetical protein
VARRMDGPPEPSLWGPVSFATGDSALRLSALLSARLDSLGLGREPEDLGRVMRDASLEITVLLSPALREPALAQRRAA